MPTVPRLLLSGVGPWLMWGIDGCSFEVGVMGHLAGFLIWSLVEYEARRM